MLTIAEELLLLGVNEETGETRPACEQVLPFGLAGAVLLELVVRRKLELRGKKVVVIDDEPTGEPILDDVLDMASRESGTRSADHWIRRLGDSDIRGRLLERLEGRGIMKKEKRRKWGLFPAVSRSVEDRERARELREKIRALPQDKRVPDERTLVLASVVLNCNLIPELYPEEEQPRAKRRLRELSRGEIYKKAVSDTVVGMQAAATVAAVAAVTAAQPARR